MYRSCENMTFHDLHDLSECSQFYKEYLILQKPESSRTN